MAGLDIELPGGLIPDGYLPSEPDGPAGSDAPPLRDVWRSRDGECVLTLVPPLGLARVLLTGPFGLVQLD